MSHFTATSRQQGSSLNTTCFRKVIETSPLLIYAGWLFFSDVRVASLVERRFLGFTDGLPSLYLYVIGRR